MAGNEDKENYKAHADEHREEENHERSLVEQLADVGFADARPIHEGVLAQAGEGEDGVDAVLLRGKGVDADREGEDQLEQVS